MKLNWVYELPAGKGKKFLNKGVGAVVLGGWRLSGIQNYSSGTPFNLATTVSFPVFNGTNRPTVASYDGWRGAIAGSKFDPAMDEFPAAGFLLRHAAD